MAHAFITWDEALGRRMCPLATFGSRAPIVHRTRLVCVDPPRADRPTITNADAVRGSIALVVRGGCSFVDKAQRIQAAGAIAMILANNSREEPFAMFTMAADTAPDVEITIPCVMMCLVDVRELFKQYPPSVHTGILTLEIHEPTGEHELVSECEAARQIAIQHYEKHESAKDDDSASGGWGAALKRKTTSLIKRWETPVESPRAAVIQSGAIEQGSAAPAPPTVLEVKPKAPVFAFVQWATSASEYVLYFAPLGDFGAVAHNAVYEGPRVVCDPLMAHEDTVHNASDLVDAIALVQRGACTFPAKLERIQRCGAVAAIVGNDDVDDEDAAFVMSVDHVRADHITIPAVMVSRRVFQRLVEDINRPMHLRILCLAGEAAAECLACAGGQPIPIQPQITNDDASMEEVSTPLARFHATCRAGDHGACQQVLDETCVDEQSRRDLALATDKFQCTALHHACAADPHAAGAEHIVTLLLHLGAVPNARDAALNTPLHLACLGGHVAIVKRLLATSTDLATMPNLGGSTPIHYAAMAGSTACIELLLSVTARRVDDDKYCFDGVDTQDADGATPLHVACAATHVDCVMYLVAANADPTVRDRQHRTAFELACSLVNEPSQSLSALHIVEKLLAAGAPVTVRSCDHNDGLGHTPLAIDAITSKAVKRELEIAYLRREVQQSRSHLESLRTELATQTERLKTLQNALVAVEQRHEATQRVASERERRLRRQEKQIEQLQLQMKTLLTVLHRENTDDRALVTTHVLADAATATTSTMDDESEASRAQDAALARDLGKKCCRERQFALAQTYFERSLDVFPLPGVARLLNETKVLRQVIEASSASPNRSEETDGPRLRRAVAQLSASESTKATLLKEIDKLEGTDPTSNDYGATVKWIEWLLALPWDTDGDHAAAPLTLETAMFDELERMESERQRRREHDAARIIQRTFREQYAVHLLRRAMASARIQRVYLRHRQRREQQRQAALAITRQRQRVESVETTVVDETDDEMETPEDESQGFDVATTVDPCVRGQRLRVERGELLESRTQFVVLQLLALDPGPQRPSRLEDGKPTPSIQWYVWKRWGGTRDEARQSMKSGPYEDRDDATTRYERLLSESRSMQQRDEKDIKPQEVVDASPPSAWTWLRASAS